MFIIVIIVTVTFLEQLLVHCNLIIMPMMGAKQKECYNEMSIITK